MANWLIPAFLFVVGAVVGSFINEVIAKLKKRLIFLSPERLVIETTKKVLYYF